MGDQPTCMACVRHIPIWKVGASFSRGHFSWHFIGSDSRINTNKALVATKEDSALHVVTF